MKMFFHTISLYAACTLPVGCLYTACTPGGTESIKTQAHHNEISTDPNIVSLLKLFSHHGKNYRNGSPVQSQARQATLLNSNVIKTYAPTCGIGGGYDGD